MVYIDIRLISLNSNYGTQLNGSKLSNLSFNFKGLSKRDNDIVMATISVIHAQIPCSFFIINSTNNNIIRNSSNIPNSYTIPIGNYNANTLTTQIIATVNAVTGVGVTISTITISSTTGILTFNFSTSCTPSTASTMASVLGLSSTNLTGLTCTLSFPLNLLGAKRLSIKLNYLSTDAYHSS